MDEMQMELKKAKVQLVILRYPHHFDVTLDRGPQEDALAPRRKFGIRFEKLDREDENRGLKVLHVGPDGLLEEHNRRMERAGHWHLVVLPGMRVIHANGVDLQSRKMSEAVKTAGARLELTVSRNEVAGVTQRKVSNAATAIGAFLKAGGEQRRGTGPGLAAIPSEARGMYKIESTGTSAPQDAAYMPTISEAVEAPPVVQPEPAPPPAAPEQAAAAVAAAVVFAAEEHAVAAEVVEPSPPAETAPAAVAAAVAAAAVAVEAAAPPQQPPPQAAPPPAPTPAPAPAPAPTPAPQAPVPQPSAAKDAAAAVRESVNPSTSKKKEGAKLKEQRTEEEQRKVEERAQAAAEPENRTKQDFKVGGQSFTML